MSAVLISRLTEGFSQDPKTGWSAYPFLQPGGGLGLDIKAVHIVAIYPGQVRGNHYHAKTTELLVLFSGRGVFYWEEEGVLREHPVKDGPVVITVPPGIKHAFKNTGETDVYLIAVRGGESGLEDPDIVRCRLL